MEMTKKSNYEAPAMEVVELKLQGTLLAGSGDTDLNGTDDIPDGNGYGSMFD